MFVWAGQNLVAADADIGIAGSLYFPHRLLRPL